MPTASEISVREVLEKLDGPFAKVAEAVASGEFALWIGSGISRKAPNLGNLIDSAVNYLRVRALDPATAAKFLPKLREALVLGEANLAELEMQYPTPFEDWPQHAAIQNRLWNKYSRLLDIRIKGEPADFMLWEAVDIRAAFAHPAAPAAEHLCVAILVLEGAVREMASANWDGFIEAAIVLLSGGANGVLQVVVDPNQLRSAGGTARLLKFHGCIVYAAKEKDPFRAYLTGSHTQIVEWPNNPLFAAMVDTVRGIATTHKSLVMGLSIQDANLQGVFSAAKKANPWPWPPDPNAPGHVFCEDQIKEGQQDVLKIVYGDAYNDNMDAIQASSHLQAWAEQVLIALVIQVIEKKLILLMTKSLQAAGRDGSVAGLASLLTGLRNDVAEMALVDPDDESRTNFVYKAIAVWSRLLGIFRTGSLPTNPDGYEPISSSGLQQLALDANAVSAGLGNFAAALSMLQHGRASGLWSLQLPGAGALADGAIGAKGLWDGADLRPIFVVKGAAEALSLEKAGAFANNNAIVLHADDTWNQVMGSGLGSRRVRGAPGRNGRVITRHLSIQSLVDRCPDVETMKTEFVSEVSL
ncbi:hypothetical protein [Mesorhizobium norvegicum]|uniref:hypothetical protein n=1 Tax=Mesorhizobium norvegicum TaxID=1085774 RepID=UPI001459FF35|nr:hypothetical protein [Mesorhizobium norvegicum]